MLRETSNNAASHDGSERWEEHVHRNTVLSCLWHPYENCHHCCTCSLGRQSSEISLLSNPPVTAQASNSRAESSRIGNQTCDRANILSCSSVLTVRNHRKAMRQPGAPLVTYFNRAAGLISSCIHRCEQSMKTPISCCYERQHP